MSRGRSPLPLVLAIVATLLGTDCEPVSPPDLATLESLAPLEVEPGEELILRGSGFVQGRAELVLVGTLSAPGQTQPRLHREELVLPVLATSATTAAARLGRRHFEQLGAGHTTFVGRATLRFPSAAGEHAPPITASLDSVRLEFFAGPSLQHAAAQRVQDRGEAVLVELGLGVTILPEGRGLVIERVNGGSPGDHAGLRPGEVIVSCGALTVASTADLAPPPRSRRVLLGVRDVEGRFRRVSCHLGRASMAPDSDRVASLAIAGCVLLVLLVAAGPLRGPLRWLGSVVAGEATGPRELLQQLGDSGRSKPTRTAVSLLIFAASPFVVMAMASTGVVVVAGVVILASVLEALHSSQGWRRLVTTWRGLWRTVPLVLACAVGAARAASVDLDAVVAFQGAVPWAWIALSDPACLMLLVLTVAATCAWEGEEVSAPATLLRGLTGALVAAVLLGGWTLSHELLGQILFAVKAWTVGLCLAGGGRGRFFVVVPLALLAGTAALAVMVVPAPDWTSAACAWVAGAAAVFWVLPAGVLLAFRPPRFEASPDQVAIDPGVGEDLAPARSPLPQPGH